ncbi:metallophosphoesterase [Paenibacillus wynnii]|uniref:metallophosphoesterase n=1 Tax=Paenibacillus wynnii TaxID=268407 RepID=UPI0006912A54|nr:metallophosphoesterase [Paenibacillus wynnii]
MDLWTTSLLKKGRPLLSLLILSASIGLAGCKNINSTNPSETATANMGDRKAVSFWVATDLHYLDKGLQDGGQAFQTYVNGGDGKLLPYIDEITEAFVYDIKQQKPDFVILSGDITNNGERSSHEELTKKLHRIEKAGTAVYVIPGNHDLFNPWARAFKDDKQIVIDSITDKEFADMYGQYGYDEALFRDKETLSYAVRAAPGLWLLMIDSSQYLNNRKFGFPQTDGRVAPSTLKWIDECVKSAAKEHASIITVLHHNLLDHTSMSISGFKLNNSQETMKNFRKNGLNLALSGHIHMQDIRLDPDPSQKSADSTLNPVYDIATSAFAVNPHQYGAMSFDPNTRSVNYKSVPVNVEGWAKANQISDPNLTNFKAYAEKSFAKGSYTKAYNSLKESEFTEEQKVSMAEAMSALNVRYFAGTAGSRAADLKDMPGFKLWNQVTDGFIPGYIQTMIAPKATDNINLQVNLTER